MVLSIGMNPPDCGSRVSHTPVLPQQLAMSSTLDHLAGVHHDKAIHICDHGPTVNDGDHALFPHQIREGGLNLDLAVQRDISLHVSDQQRGLPADDQGDTKGPSGQGEAGCGQIVPSVCSRR